jgi:hypothetical protein
MSFLKAARFTVIGSLALLAAACASPTPRQDPGGSDDNGANCGGTPANQQNCINNQNRMNTDPAP